MLPQHRRQGNNPETPKFMARKPFSSLIFLGIVSLPGKLTQLDTTLSHVHKLP